MIGKLIFHIISGILGLFLAIKLSESGAVKFIYGVEFTGPIKTLLITGGIVGLFNFFIKPVLKTIFLPLRILTFGLVSLIINMVLVWIAVDILSPIKITGLLPLFWTTFMIWILSFFFGVYSPKKRKSSKQ